MIKVRSLHGPVAKQILYMDKMYKNMSVPIALSSRQGHSRGSDE